MGSRLKKINLHSWGWRVNGEGLGRAKELSPLLTSKDAANNRLTKTININWEKANIAKLMGLMIL